MPDDPPPPEECANCGARIPRGAKSCPECGADERTGWRETSIYDDLELPESAYDDEEQSPRRPSSPRVNGIAWYWWLIAALLVIGMIAGFVVRVV